MKRIVSRNGRNINKNSKNKEIVMATQKETTKKEKVDKSPKVWLSSYTKNKEKSCAALITHLMMSGANEKSLIDAATNFNIARIKRTLT